MDDVPTKTSGTISRGDQAFLWIVGGAASLLGLLLYGQFESVKDLAKTVNALQIEVSVLSKGLVERASAQSDRATEFDRRLFRMENKMFFGNIEQPSPKK